MSLGRSFAPVLGVVALLVAVACHDAGGPSPASQPFPNPVAQVTPLPVSSVTASGSQPPNVPENTLDNNLGTRWSAEGDGQWIRYDLGASKEVGRVDIAWYLGNEWAYTFDIQVSPDAAAWTTVFSGRSSGQTLQPEGYGFPTQTGRYVRIIGHGSQSSDGLSPWNSITEVDIYNVLPVTAFAASGSEAPNVPENTLDNNLGTRWSSEGVGEWIQYDLGAATNIGGVDIAWYLGNQWAYAFDIQVSADAVTWATVFSGRSSAGNVQYQRYEFSTVTCRYVRIIGHGSQSTDGTQSFWNSITEVDIHPGSGTGACPQPPPTGPEPGPTATIVFQDDFESGTYNSWTAASPDTAAVNYRYSVISGDPQKIHSGSHSLQVLFDRSSPYGTWGALGLSFSTGYDELYIKFFVRFELGFDESNGLHMFAFCGRGTAGSCLGNAGFKPDGSNFFSAGLDPEYVPGNPTLKPLHFYSYWPDMTSCDNYDPALRNCFGDRTYQTGERVQLVPGVWQEVVMHVKMNTPAACGGTQYDGSQELWINGIQKISVQNMCWRSTSALNLNEIWLSNYMSSYPTTGPISQHLWIDDVTVWRP